ncbi:MAG: hypothetical protein GY859_02920 [Desulfobacterales bacterium]|nr:hypothetical protein [Desulfobacterales bacterium]
MDHKDRRRVHKPEWMDEMERRIAARIPLGPNALSSIKLFLITPALYLSFKSADVLPNSSAWIFFLFIFFCALDYLDGVVARVKELETSFGRVYDHLTDYPLLFLTAWQCIDLTPAPLLIAKLALDVILLIQFVLKPGIAENRVRAVISTTTLVSLLFFSQGWAGAFINGEVVNALLLANIAFSAAVALYNARILQLRFVADVLSGANLMCGLISMYFAYHDRLEISLLFLIMGALFDGFDGAAARKWGGTRWGVYSDDVADGVNYGIAPGVALFFVVGGWQGAVTGFLYSFFTVSRLVYFTLNKDDADPDFFCGVPSTFGGLIVLCSLILFPTAPVLTGFLVGAACAQMVSFDTHYRHLGRALASREKRYILGLPLYAMFLILGAFVWGVHASIALLLLVVLGYGLAPSFLHMKHVMTSGGGEGSELK